ncbi:hypothetical protein G6F50_014191 [Rhizopus delemar]|uniref:Uncharacterized protein n=1 Tax=Rhizopus delemar TaxID=936053 RepID=A0A9P6Y971_9FUNG|nr:hypothetical protein G6F50_014191 [Rhizopus delemar]
MRRAGIDGVVERPDRATRRVGVRQIHRPAVRAAGRAVGHDQIVQQHRHAVRVVAVQLAGGLRQAHIHDHRAGQETALPVATAIIEAHAGRRVRDGGQQPGFTGRARQQRIAGVQAVFHRQQPARAAHRKASGHLRQRPLRDAAACRRPAPQSLAGDVGPGERLIGNAPDRAFSYAAQHGPDTFGSGGHGGGYSAGKGKGPALTNAPP